MPAPEPARSARRPRAAATNPWITPALFRFLRELAENNNREWFQANKARYRSVVRDPLLEWIEFIAEDLEKISPWLRADPSPNGGSLFRIYRDTRFSRDKSPYKTHAGIHFRHAAGRDVHGPGVYLHLAPRNVFVAAGVWNPGSDALRRIRQAIVVHPDRFVRATSARRAPLGESERLRRAPRGFDPDHPLIEDLKRKSFLSSVAFTQREACSAEFPGLWIRAVRRMAPLMEFLASALKVDW
ncbi:MAG: DUF2461 domain-containing protein [Myxococcota bacterium]